MKLTQAVVCFMDILGFAAMVDKDQRSEDPSYLPRIHSLIRCIVDGISETGLGVVQFSDSIVIHAPYSVENALLLLRKVSEAQLQATCLRVLVRGGIAFGKHYSDDKIIYSQGLVDAYRLEAKAARVPRIVVDKNLIALMRGTAASEDQLNKELENLLIWDRDTYPFLDYLNRDNLDDHVEAIRQLISDADCTDVGILSKYEWLCNYHNHVCERFGHESCSFALPQLRPWRDGL